MSKDILKEHLRANKQFHFNNEASPNYLVSTGSLIMDIAMDGGVRPGMLRFTGISEGGKTSEMLTIANNFLSDKKNTKRKGVLIKSEGRLSPQMEARSGIKFVETPEDWDDGTCFAFKTNVFETAIDLIRSLVMDNPEKIQYVVVIDSMDALMPKGDFEKKSDEAVKVAGGALLLSDFLRRMSLAFSSMGHLCLLSSQIRETIKLNQYEKGTPKLTNASGGHAITHYADWILEAQSRWKVDIILDSKGKPVGHFAKFTLRKTANEKSNTDIRYPVKYNQTKGQSIWKAYEVVDLLVMFELVTKGGAWFTFTPSTLAEIKNAKLTCPEKVQGMEGLREIFEENPALTELFVNKFKSTLTKG